MTSTAKTQRALRLGAIIATTFIGSIAQAGTGLCFFDPGFGSAYELNQLNCDGNDCLLELDRPFVPTIPLASSGAMTATGNTLHINWNNAFGGTTQGTIHIACSVDLSNGLPASGPGMFQRIASFSPAPGIEFISGQCRIAQCSSSAGGARSSGLDPETRQQP